MSSGVGVDARKDIVLVLSYFYGEIKISALKISLKLDIIDFFCFLDTRFVFFNIFWFLKFQFQNGIVFAEEKCGFACIFEQPLEIVECVLWHLFLLNYFCFGVQVKFLFYNFVSLLTAEINL